MGHLCQLQHVDKSGKSWGSELRRTRPIDERDRRPQWKRRNVQTQVGNVELNKRKPPDERRRKRRGPMEN